MSKEKLLTIIVLSITFLIALKFASDVGIARANAAAECGRVSGDAE